MSLEEHHKFILDAMDRQNAIARNFVAELEAENARLKAEVIRLQQVRGYEHYLSAEIGSMHQENVRLKAEVERLTKAGDQSIAISDKMREMIGDHHWTLMYDQVRKMWNAAKNGGQP